MIYEYIISPVSKKSTMLALLINKYISQTNVPVQMRYKYILIKCICGLLSIRPLSRSESHQINQRSIHLPILDVFIVQPNCPEDRLKIFQSERESVFLDSPVDLNLESLRGSKKIENIKWLISVLLQY